ncbi:Oidioi.mRNA.OKI2018_I69.chr2.g4940.t1.cds [Oikopleura dioica]|uniref:Oidioi.mRNA.OKI2018_I69.chr2.g4940.t1.cds n=1 Tax=Oikopleura dioica TaxID=34765 RepID=A0ABN7T367_OIKDI|nr:Oidioi.mRNA.OKI2018_I69.chr2.g4940.t1.cds [Oikopleura dioica]
MDRSQSESLFTDSSASFEEVPVQPEDVEVLKRNQQESREKINSIEGLPHHLRDIFHTVSNQHFEARINQSQQAERLLVLNRQNQQFSIENRKLKTALEETKQSLATATVDRDHFSRRKDEYKAELAKMEREVDEYKEEVNATFEQQNLNLEAMEADLIKFKEKAERLEQENNKLNRKIAQFNAQVAQMHNLTIQADDDL